MFQAETENPSDIGGSKLRSHIHTIADYYVVALVRNRSGLHHTMDIHWTKNTNS